jgi:hypothetical protein
MLATYNLRESGDAAAWPKARFKDVVRLQAQGWTWLVFNEWLSEDDEWKEMLQK